MLATTVTLSVSWEVCEPLFARKSCKMRSASKKSTRKVIKRTLESEKHTKTVAEYLADKKRLAKKPKKKHKRTPITGFKIVTTARLHGGVLAI
jgi:hypothetical protein